MICWFVELLGLDVCFVSTFLGFELCVFWGSLGSFCGLGFDSVFWGVLQCYYLLRFAVNGGLDCLWFGEVGFTVVLGCFDVVLCLYRWVYVVLFELRL